MAGQWVDLIKQDKSLQSVVKMGLVVFQDVSSGSAFGARTFVPLSSDFDRFRAAFSEIPNPLADAKAGKLTVLDDVWSQDTILGLDTAVSKVQWTPNSSKHIVLIGSAVPQLESDGNQKNPLGRPTNRIEEFFTNKEGSLFKFGWNSTGLTPRQVIQRATPAGGDDYEQAVGKKNLHAIAIAASGENFVMQHWQNVNKSTTEMNALLAKIKEARSVVTNDQIDAFKDKYAQNDAGLDAIIKRYLWELMDNTRPRTSAVYQEFTNNDGGDPGLFRDVAATEAATNAAVKDLGTSVTKAFALLKKTREGSVDSSSDELKRKEDTDNLGSSFWKIVDASGKILKDDGVQLGEAPVRNEEGVKWAEKKVMIGGDELDKLVSSLSGMHDKFKNMVKKSKRQDVSDVLNELKALAATATTGQAFTADSSLASVLTDLPLRTSALTTTPKSLAVMSGPDFKAWLSKIDAAIRRCRDIKDGRAGNSWFALSSYSPNAKFTVLKLTELP
jgi:hypothetical protein